MIIWHKYTFNHKDNVENIFIAWGIRYKRSPLPGSGYLLHIEVPESDQYFNRILDLAINKNALDIFTTTFSEEEILSAAWVRVCPAFEQGYPEPYDTGEWEKFTYSTACDKCGTGLIQYAPFRIKKEPRLGSRHFVCLYSTYTLFCVFSAAQEISQMGVVSLEFIAPIIMGTSKPSEIVTQWKMLAVAAPALMGENESTTCRTCGTRKYKPHLRGYMELKKDVFNVDEDVLQTYEWFGSGHAAYREILISNRLAQIFLKKKWRGVVLKPTRLI